MKLFIKITEYHGKRYYSIFEGTMENVVHEGQCEDTIDVLGNLVEQYNYGKITSFPSTIKVNDHQTIYAMEVGDYD